MDRVITRLQLQFWEWCHNSFSQGQQYRLDLSCSPSGIRRLWLLSQETGGNYFLSTQLHWRIQQRRCLHASAVEPPVLLLCFETSWQGRRTQEQQTFFNEWKYGGLIDFSRWLSTVIICTINCFISYISSFIYPIHWFIDWFDWLIDSRAL